MSDSFKPSKQAAMMLSSINDMDDNDLDWLQDMGMGIASTIEEITARIENPTKNRVKGCEVIQLGAELFLPMRSLKQRLELGDMTLESYMKDLDQIVECFDQIVFANSLVLSNPKVRNHMKQLANSIVVHLEAGAVLNTMFGILSQNR